MKIAKVNVRFIFVPAGCFSKHMFPEYMGTVHLFINGTQKYREFIHNN